MIGEHERFLMLAARDLHEGLGPEESRILQEHLAACPSCRRAVTGMRRDDAALRTLLVEAPVAPRVRSAVIDAARGRRRFGSGARLVPVLAAVLIVGILGFAVVAGGIAPRPSTEPTPSAPPATPNPSASPSPDASAAPSGTPAPSASTVPSGSASLAPALGGSVNGAYAYSVRPGATRRDSVSARLDDGPTGEWSRMVPADGSGNSFGGPITCIVIDGQDAWLAGPATFASDGSTNLAALLVVHDAGPGGEADRAVLWMTDPGQTLATMEGWCRDKFIPADPYPLDDGNVTITPPAG